MGWPYWMGTVWLIFIVAAVGAVGWQMMNDFGGPFTELQRLQWKVRRLKAKQRHKEDLVYLRDKVARFQRGEE